MGWLENIAEMIENNDLVIPRAFYKEMEDKNFFVPEISEEEVELLYEKLDRPSFDDVV